MKTQNKLIKSKYFTAGLLIGLSLISLGTYAYTTQPGAIGSLFYDKDSVGIFDENRTYRLHGDAVADGTLDNTEIQYDDTYTIKQLGIGTTSPSSKLHIIGGEDAALDKNGYIMFGSENNANVIIDNNEIMARNDGNTSPLYIQNDGGNTLFNKNGGNVGIGTISPSSKLHIIGGGIKVNNGYGIGFNNEEALNTGVTTDGAKFYYDYNMFGTNLDALIIEKTDGNNNTPDGGIVFTNKGQDNNRKVSMSIRGNGNIGIGTTSPSQKLDVNGNIRTSGRNILFGDGAQRIYGDNSSAFYADSNHSNVSQLIFRDKEDDFYGKVYGANGDYFGLMDGDGNRSYLTHKDDYTQFRINNSTKMHIKSDGSIGIGTTTPNAQLELKGDGKIRLNGADNDDYWDINAYNDGTNLNFERNGTTNMRLYDNGNMYVRGNVGIGTTSPSQKLDVVGNIEVSGGDYTLRDNNGDWSIGGNSENLEFREPEDGNKLWMHFQDDKGLQIDAGGAVKATCIGNCF